jgi:hypothetical protein
MICSARLVMRQRSRCLRGQAIELREDAFVASSPVIADGRMHPYEWIPSENGHLMKVHASRRGDDHFLPGPNDISWDLAGAIVE